MSLNNEKLQNSVIVSKDYLKNQNPYAVLEWASLQPDEVKTYDLADHLSVDINSYDLRSTEVQVMYLDTQEGSVTNDFYIDASAFVICGFSSEGIVKIKNTHTTALDCIVRVRVTKFTNK